MQARPSLALPGHKDLKAPQGLKVRLVLPVRRESKVCRVRLVLPVLRDHKVNKVHRVRKVKLDHRAILESRGHKAFQATPALKAPVVLKVR